MDNIWDVRERKESRMTPGFGSKSCVKSGIYGYGDRKGGTVREVGGNQEFCIGHNRLEVLF